MCRCLLRVQQGWGQDPALPSCTAQRSPGRPVWLGPPGGGRPVLERPGHHQEEAWAGSACGTQEGATFLQRWPQPGLPEVKPCLRPGLIWAVPPALWWHSSSPRSHGEEATPTPWSRVELINAKPALRAVPGSVPRGGGRASARCLSDHQSTLPRRAAPRGREGCPGSHLPPSPPALCPPSSRSPLLWPSQWSGRHQISSVA